MKCPRCNGTGNVELDGVTMGDLIECARKVKKMTQEELASLSGVSRPQIANIELGRSDIPTRTLILIAAALGVSPGDLLPPSTQQQDQGRTGA
jgi:transcriptional regulator with XRE-family HTH domain